MFIASQWVFLTAVLSSVSAFAGLEEGDSAESGSGMPTTEEVDVLELLSWHAANSSNVSVSFEAETCLTLLIGQYATLTLPTHRAFGARFADQFSVLMQMRSSQREERALVSVLSPHGHILLQVRLGPHTFTFITTHQRLYEFPVESLSDGRWHWISVAVSAHSLTLYVDCEHVESVNWSYPGMDISTDSLLMVGGLVEGPDTPFEGAFRQMTFLMGDPGAARQHCSLHPPLCGKITPKPPSYPQMFPTLEVYSSDSASARKKT